MSNLPENNSNSTKPNNNFESNFSKLERGGLNYIKNERNYLILSALVPIYIIIVQCINLGYIFTAPLIGPIIPRPPPNPINVFTPIVILLIISFFGLINFKYLLKWKENIKNYEANTDKCKSLTSILYEIIKNMENIKVIFLILNIISFYYILWFILWILRIMDPFHPPPPVHVVLLNGLSLGGLFMYLFLQWKHFSRWNRKLKQLKLFEKQIFHEICGTNQKNNEK